MQTTRWEILQILKRSGGATVDELAKDLGMTPMGIRLHLVVLERDGLVRRTTERHRPGRPTLRYHLTDVAEDQFPKHYDDLADALLASIQENLGAEEAEAVCSRAAERLVRSYRAKISAETIEGRLEELTRALTEGGGFAQWEHGEDALYLHDYNCPFHRVARRHEAVCAIDQEFLENLLGAHVERVSSLLENGRRCTYRILPKREEP